jgi:hypothetical protein
MSLYQYSLLSVFAIVLALIIIDPNVGVFIDLQVKLLRIRIITLWMRMTMYPRIKYNNWEIQRRLKKIQRELNVPKD